MIDKDLSEVASLLNQRSDILYIIELINEKYTNALVKIFPLNPFSKKPEILFDEELKMLFLDYLSDKLDDVEKELVVKGVVLSCQGDLK